MDELIAATLTTCASAETRRVYRWQLEKFLRTGLPLNGDAIAHHLQQLRDSGLSSSSVAVAVAAIRRLAKEALHGGLITAAEFGQLQGVAPGKVRRIRAGAWLTVTQVFDLLWLPDRATYWGKRDACILSLMAGCGLKRAEMANLKWSHYQQLEGLIWLVVARGAMRRTIPVPLWAQEDADAWYFASRDEPPKSAYSLQHLERTRPRDHEYIAGGMRGDGVHALVQRYGKELGRSLTPDDLRLSLARLLRKSGAALEQIQATLGLSMASTVNMLKAHRF
jgi:integrase